MNIVCANADGGGILYVLPSDEIALAIASERRRADEARAFYSYKRLDSNLNRKAKMSTIRITHHYDIGNQDVFVAHREVSNLLSRWRRPAERGKHGHDSRHTEGSAGAADA